MTMTGMILVNVLLAATFLMVILSTVGRTSINLLGFASETNDTNYNYLDPKGPYVQFILFRRDSSPYNLKLSQSDDFKNSGYDTAVPTKIIIHGFISSTFEPVFQLNKDAYLSVGDHNVIGMDWSKLCDVEYFTAMRGAQIAGNALGEFVKWITVEGVKLADIHIMGHSLGAHVAAMGANFLNGTKVGRITGLDPAGPGYSQVPDKFRLDPTDANLVDVIHTSVRVLGLPQPQGHIDFYPNGGRLQPGCPDLYNLWTMTDAIQCNHGRAYYYFAETIRNKKAFRSIRCANISEAMVGKCSDKSDVYMGQEDTYKEGLYYMKTKGISPFSF